MQVAVDSIVVRDRVRKEIGDLSPLVESMRKHGQLSPILLTRTYDLIAGHRRLMAARRLGWRTVEAVCVRPGSPVEKLEMELEENVHRKDFLPTELLEGYARLERLRKPTLRARVAAFFKRFFARLFGRRRSGHARRDIPAAMPPPDTPGSDAEYAL